MRAFATLLVLFALSAGTTVARQSPASDVSKPEGGGKAPAALKAVRVEVAPAIDGVLDEAVWQRAAPIGSFVQRFPDEGRPASQRTEVRLLYTSDALYVGARMYDTAPDSVVARLVRRDVDADADLFGIFIDGYHDRLTGFYFGVNAAGTLYDGTLYNDSWDDDAWDGIWLARVSRDDAGWVAEMKIPFSQLRFHPADEMTWGVNFTRYIQRRQEDDFLVFVPRRENAFVSRFRDLGGLRGLRSGMGVEVMPYVTAGADFTEQPAGNPFRDGSDVNAGAGLDLKVGLTSSLVLNATVNPDFGQVEVDPAVVNLSDRETFFPEKRPFFIEGQNVFNFATGGANNMNGFNWGNPELFYTRRIGRTPQGSEPEADFVERPEAVPILGAAKLTGRLAGANAGFVGAATGRSYTRFETDGVQDRVPVEPLTYYGVLRMQKELNAGQHGLGFLSTLTQRQFGGPRLRDEINEGAYVTGVDGWTRFGPDQAWALTFWGAASHIRGTEARIESLQRSALHYLQRPDLKAADVDPTRTALTGFAGRLYLNKQHGAWMFNAALGAIDPYFDANDLGFQWNSNYINSHVFTGYRWTDPDRYTRYKAVMGAYARSFDFDGETIASFFWGRGDVQLKNYWSAELGGVLFHGVMDPRRTRGGPLTYSPPGFNLFGDFSTDSRKPLRFGAMGSLDHSAASRMWDAAVEATWQPAPNVNVSVGPNLSRGLSEAQYVTQVEDPTATATYGHRYVFANLDQWTLASNVRLNWTFTPALSLQLFMQPLLAAGDYTRFKELAAPRSFRFDVYGEGASTLDPETLEVDPDGAGAAAPFELSDPSFRFASLRGNAVLRWEFRPGSTLYFVWTQLQEDVEEEGAFQARHSLNRLVERRPDHYFRVKLSYWLGR